MEEEVVSEGKKEKKVTTFIAVEPKIPNLSWYLSFPLKTLQLMHLSLEQSFTFQQNVWEIEGSLSKERCSYLQGFYERLLSIREVLIIKEKENVELFKEKEIT